MDKIIVDGIQEILGNLSKSNISFSDKTVLVAGGAGFLGSWLCDVLVAQHATVVSFDNYSTGQSNNIAHLLGKNPQFTQLEVDVCSVGSIEFPIGIDFDFIFHFASPAAPPSFQTHPVEILRANTIGTFQLLTIAEKYNAKMIYASTSEVYGNPLIKGPISEDYNGNVNPLGIRGCYNEAKRAGEAFIKAFERQHGVQGVILRIFNTYGPRIEEGRVIPNFIKAVLSNQPLTIFGDGSQTRSFVYVTDEIEGILRAGALPEAKGAVINLGNDIKISIQELAELFSKFEGRKLTHKYLPLPPDDPVRRCPNIQKAKKLLCWEPKVTIETGLEKTIGWFSRNVIANKHGRKELKEN
ncbi:MAG: NAD-dependent epimerase/dehydratase family protein [Candidatus Heimdallarchaeota archaeon]